MKKLIVLAVASLFATSAFAGEMKWSGSAGWRYDTKTQDDSLNSTNNTGTAATNTAFGKDLSKYQTRRQQVRGNLAVTGGWENVEYGAGLRTGGASTTTTTADWVSLQNGGDAGIALEQAWFRYVRDFGSVDFSVTVGRQMNVMAYESKSENFFDRDVRWDGFGWKFKSGMFGFNAAQYILGGKSGVTNGSSTINYTESSENTVGSKSRFNTLFAFQPHMTWKFSDEIETMFAVGYYIWNDDSNSNRTSAGTNLSNNTGTVAPVASQAFKMHNPRQWQFYNTWTLPYGLNFAAEYVMANTSKYDSSHITGYAGTTAPEASKSAWSAGLIYGKVAKAHDWSVSYFYGKKGLASVISAYTDSGTFTPDNKGHTFKASYAIADNFVLGWKGQWLKEVERKNALTGLAYSGVNVNQEMKTKYMEFTAGVNF